MDAKQRAELVRFHRIENKQARSRLRPAAQLTPQEERDQNLISQSRRALRSRRQGANSTERERLRRIREGGTRGMGDAARDHVIRNSNVRFQSRTGFSSRNGVEVTLSPAERVNRVGVTSRRRHVSAGSAPPAPGEAGHAEFVRRYREGTRQRSHQRTLRRVGVRGALAGE